MARLWDSLPPEEKNYDLKVEVVPSELLPVLLDSAEHNVGDMAPGAPLTEATLEICAEIRFGMASPEQIRAWAWDSRLHEALRAGVRFELATYLGNQGVTRPDQVEGAIAEWREVLRLYPRLTAPRRWAIATMELSFCYANRRKANPAKNMSEALRLLGAALEVLTEEKYPEDFALAQSRQANLLLDIGSDTVNIDQSLSAFEAALRVYTCQSYPEDWAITLSNMATAYLTRGGYRGMDDLRRAAELMEQSLTVRTREGSPYEWAMTQLNLGLALSRLPADEGGGAHQRALESLRGTYEVFSELGDEHKRRTAAYNLGITLTRLGGPALAEEAVNRLEESLQWLIRTGQGDLAADAVACLSESYVKWLQSEAAGPPADEICRRALAAFNNHGENESGMRANYETGLWLLQHAEKRDDRLEMAGLAFERVLSAMRAPQYAELRARTLGNMATVLLLQRRGSRDLNRVRARDCMDEALRIMRSLPVTPERESIIGLIQMNKICSGLGES